MGRKHGKKNTEKSRKKIQKNQKEYLCAADNGFDPLLRNLCHGRTDRKSNEDIL